MKAEAIPRMNSWTCGFCKRMVTSPVLWSVDPGFGEIAEGRCKVCGTGLIFRRNTNVEPKTVVGTVKKAGVEWGNEIPELRERYPVEKEEKGRDAKKSTEEFSEKYFLDQGYVRHIFPKLREEGRPIVVDFLNKPQLLKWFEKYAEEKGLFLSEVVTGFAAKGVLKLKEEAHEKENVKT